MAEIEYRAKSAEGKVRHPFFKGLREDHIAVRDLAGWPAFENSIRRARVFVGQPNSFKMQVSAQHYSAASFAGIGGDQHTQQFRPWAFA